ncbi:hypothetical protein ACHAWF_018532 [Thalassiosira exigua]
MTSQTMTIKVSTNKPTPSAKEVKHVNEEDLLLLKAQDPFMYHSIPAVQKATLSFEGVDCKILANSNDPQTNSKVSRKTRLSTESHLCVLIEQILAGEDDI